MNESSLRDPGQPYRTPVCYDIADSQFYSPDGLSIVQDTGAAFRSVYFTPVGASLLARNYVWSERGNNEIVRSADNIVLNYTHGLSDGEHVVVRCRLQRFSSVLARAVVLSPTQAYVPALIKGLPDEVHPGAGGTNTNLCGVMYASRYSSVGSWIRIIASKAPFAGRMRLLDFVAQGGDNEPEMLVKFYTEIMPAARRLAKVGGFMLGNLGGDLTSWAGDNPINLRRIREITDTGCLFINTEGSANSPTATPDTPARIAQVQAARYWMEREMSINPRFYAVDPVTPLVDYTNANGAARAGLHVDDVHYTQAGAVALGEWIAPRIAPFFRNFDRKMRLHAGDRIITGTAATTSNSAPNVARGFYTLDGTVTCTFAAGQPGSGTAAGTMDEVFGPLLRTGGAQIDVTASVTNLTGADTGKRSTTFVVAKAATGIGELRIPIVGPAGAEMWRRMGVGDYEVAVDYALGGTITNLQSMEIFADLGEGTTRLGAGFSFESPAYQSLLTVARTTVPESGKIWFPSPVKIAAIPTNFRIVIRLGFISGVAGAATVTISDNVVRIMPRDW